jgi:hypothetical protein
VFTFAAKTSEVLLAAGLVVSTANFLTDGKVMGNNAGIATAWAWAQALAIDSSLGVTFHSVFTSVKQRDWIKVLCYGSLTLLLAAVAGTITNIDTYSHAIHITIASATLQVGLNIKLLTTLRAIAVVGFVLMSRLKDTSFKELYEVVPSPAAPEGSKTPEDVENTTALIRRLIAEALTQQGTITEEQHILPSSMERVTTETAPKQANAPLPPSGEESGLGEQGLLKQQDDSPEARGIRLARAYQELAAEGKRISGRTLAARAHLRRTTCNQWLAVYHPESVDEDPEEEPEHAQQPRKEGAGRAHGLADQ